MTYDTDNLKQLLNSDDESNQELFWYLLDGMNITVYEALCLFLDCLEFKLNFFIDFGMDKRYVLRRDHKIFSLNSEYVGVIHCVWMNDYYHLFIRSNIITHPRSKVDLRFRSREHKYHKKDEYFAKKLRELKRKMKKKINKVKEYKNEKFRIIV